MKLRPSIHLDETLAWVHYPELANSLSGRELCLQLTQGFVALLDPQDAGQLRFNWSIIGGRHVSRRDMDTYICMKHPMIYLPRAIMQPVDGQLVEYRDLRLLPFRIIDCRRSNLRSVSRSLRRVSKRKGCSSKHLGVCWNQKRKTWQASTRIDGRLVFLGYHADELQAAAAYQAARCRS